jgi:hypothetical protein
MERVMKITAPENLAEKTVDRLSHDKNHCPAVNTTTHLTNYRAPAPGIESTATGAMSALPTPESSLKS